MNLTIYEGLLINRRRKGLSQEELAKLAGVSRNSISMMERGEYNPTIEYLTKVFDALGLAINIRLEGKGTNQEE